MISCTGLTKDFGDFRTVSDASFHVPAGSICALLGPNGAGSSRFKPTAGEAEVCGLPAGDLALKRITGILPEGLALFDALTIAEHLEMTGAVYKIKAAETRSRTDQLLRALRLEDGRRTFIHQCSYGMKKKTALALALLPNPRALLLDEPFEGIDPITAEIIRSQLRAIARRWMAMGSPETAGVLNCRTTFPDEPQASRTIGTPA